MGKRQLFTHSLTYGALFLPVSAVRNGRCLILSPTIHLPLIQGLALLHWLPIEGCSGGMHRLHLPAGRIPAFLNKAPPPPTHTPRLPLTLLPRTTITRPLFKRQTQTLLGSNSSSDVATSHRTAQHDTAYGRGCRHSSEIEPADRDHSKRAGDSFELRERRGFIWRWIHLIWKGSAHQNQTPGVSTQLRCQCVLQEGTECAVLQYTIKPN